MHLQRLLSLAILALATYPAHAALANSSESPKESLRVFAAYDFGEALFNRFQSLSGEVGLKLPNGHLVRIVHMNVWLTEEHLRSDFAGAVDGSGVEGRMLGVEAFYSYPLWMWNHGKEAIRLSPSVGYYDNEYTHKELGSRVQSASATFGLEVSLREEEPFGIPGLYYAVTLPARVTLNPIEETTLGDATIASNRIDTNIWLFIGYQL